MIAATMLSVTFATRGAMATNKPVIEVLHFVGAKNGFIAGHFQRHFLLLGFEGGAIGGGAAIVLFALAGADQPLVCRHRRRRADSGAVRLVSIGLSGYVAVLAQVVLIAVVTALTSRHTVNRTLRWKRDRICTMFAAAVGRCAIGWVFTMAAGHRRRAAAAPAAFSGLPPRFRPRK